MYKLTVYEKTENSLLEVHKYISEDKAELANLSAIHMNNNDQYVNIMISYLPAEADIMQV